MHVYASVIENLILKHVPAGSSACEGGRGHRSMSQPSRRYPRDRASSIAIEFATGSWIAVDPETYSIPPDGPVLAQTPALSDNRDSSQLILRASSVCDKYTFPST